MKIIFLSGIFYLLSLITMAQPTKIGNINGNKDSVFILINAKQVAHYLIDGTQSDNDILLKKGQSNKIKSIVVKIKGADIENQRYSRSLLINGEPDTTIAEIKGKPGNFDISNLLIRKRIIDGKPVTIRLLLNPANSMMLMASRSIYLGNLLMQ